MHLKIDIDRKGRAVAAFAIATVAHPKAAKRCSVKRDVLKFFAKLSFYPFFISAAFLIE